MLASGKWYTHSAHVQWTNFAGAVTTKQRQLISQRLLYRGQLLLWVLQLAATPGAVEGQHRLGRSAKFG